MRRGDLSSIVLEVDDARGARTYTDDDFPVSLGGGEGIDVELPGAHGTVAWLGIAEGELFVQPEDGQVLRMNGTSVRESCWLHEGEVLALGPARLRLEKGPSGLVLRAEAARAAGKPVLRPPGTPPRTSASDGSAVGEVPRIRAVEFHPARAVPPAAVSESRTSRWRSPAGIGASILLLLLGLAALFLFTAHSVKVVVRPSPDELRLNGGLIVPLGERFLARPGTYRLWAEKEGYRRLESEIVVGTAATLDFHFELERLPDRVRVVAEAEGEPVAGAVVRLDGEEAGETPSEVLELSAGTYGVEVSAERYRTWTGELVVEGGGREVEVAASLEPLWAAVTFVSEPAGARLRVDGEEVGRTPVEVPLLEGSRRYQLTLAGFRPGGGRVEVVAQQDARVGPIRLQPAAGNLVLTSEPEGAAVSVGGVFRGRTPLELDLAPGRDHVLQFSARGHAPTERTVRLAPGAAEEVSVRLEPRLGEVAVAAFPPKAELWVNGESQGIAHGQVLRLPVDQAHVVEVKREGHVPFRQEITPLHGVRQEIEAHLETSAAARERSILPVLETPHGHRMILVQPGRFQMGASRREPGRRANETLRQVELTSRFYLSAHEVSNAQFQRFRSEHDSGTSAGQSLAIFDRPVVRITWQDAARYCNWLSAQEGLPAAYVERDGQLVAAEPINEGYRLPTEAEWAWAARYGPGGGPRKYPWGDALPVAEGAGNFADASAEGSLSGVLKEYRDGYPATAPVDAFGPDRRGFFQLGGNVAEWVQDIYEIRSSPAGALERDPRGPASGGLHVIRGSSWMHSTVTELRLSFRDYGKDPRPDVGFRIARSVLGPVPESELRAAPEGRP
ncbi:MAG: SUMF1/EgtB/PvdO family nonheme iron enzyme [Holophagales bacterium]|nr:SUMF1/EgtB/PvdO family nonheme iron enzyme [Holophagales bacterium]